MDSSTKLLLNSRQAAAALSVSEKTLWSWTAPRGPIPAVRIGAAVRYSVATLERFVAEREALVPAEGGQR